MSKRLFVAIPIRPEALLLSQRAFLMSNLKEETINWVKEENFHLTLKFIGKTSSKRIPEIIAALTNCCSKFDPFPIILERVGIFGSRYHARVVWVGIRENKQLQKLYESLNQEFEKIDFSSDRQNFVPHFTLGRIKNIQHKDHFKRVMERVENGFIQDSKVDRIVLFESVLTPEGPVYKPIQRFALGLVAK